VVRVSGAGVCSSDVARAFERGAYHYPLVMGHEFAGRVVETSQDARRFKIEDRVAVFPLIPCQTCESCRNKDYVCCSRYDYFGSRRDGGFAEYVGVPEWNLIKLPAFVDDVTAAVMEPLAVAARALSRAGFLRTTAIPYKKAAILGAGFLGQAAARMLALFHPRLDLTIVDRHAWKLNLIRSKSIRTARIATPAEWDRFLSRNASAFDFVLEAVGAPRTYRASLALAKPKSTVVWMGNISGDLTLPKKDVSSILRKEIKILGTWNSGFHPTLANDWTRVLALLKRGLDVSALISVKTPLAQLPAVMQQLYRHKKGVEPRRWLKVVVA